MITVFNQAKQIILGKKGDCLLLANFEHTYMVSPFMRHAEKEILMVRHLIKKNAFIGMTFPQQMILKGFRFLIKKEALVHFNTRQEAIDYLIE